MVRVGAPLLFMSALGPAHQDAPSPPLSPLAPGFLILVHWTSEGIQVWRLADLGYSSPEPEFLLSQRGGGQRPCAALSWNDWPLHCRGAQTQGRGPDQGSPMAQSWQELSGLPFHGSSAPLPYTHQKFTLAHFPGQLGRSSRTQHRGLRPHSGSGPSLGVY